MLVASPPPVCFLGIDFDNATNLNNIYISNVNVSVGNYNFIGKSGYFDGQTSYLEIPFFNNVALNTFSVCLWVKRTGTGTGPQGILFNGDCHTLNASIEIRSESQTSTGGGIITQYTYARQAFTNVSVTYNDWHHECLIYNGQTLLFYVDNVQVGSVIASGSTVANKCPMKVGLAYFATSPVSVGFFSGYMDEIWFCPGALTADQINKLYHHQLLG